MIKLVNTRPRADSFRASTRPRQKGDTKRFGFTMEWKRGKDRVVLESNPLTHLNGMLTHDLLYHGAVASLIAHQGVSLPRLVSLDDEQLAYGFQDAARILEKESRAKPYLSAAYFDGVRVELEKVRKTTGSNRASSLRLRATQAVLAMEVAGMGVSGLLMDSSPLKQLLSERSNLKAVITNESNEGVKVALSPSNERRPEHGELAIEVVAPRKRSNSEMLKSDLTELDRAIHQPLHQWLFSKTR